MEVVITKNREAASVIAADIIEAVVLTTPHAVLGVATGSTPVETYRELGRRVHAGRLSLAATSAFMLDEYVGLAAHHAQAYRRVIDEIFVRLVDIDPSRVHGPDGMAADLDLACTAYEDAICAAGGVDVQLLGVGTDGHIGFNEPSSSLASRTRIKTLTARTRQDNARFFGGDLDAVPTHCLTQGVGTILEAKSVVLLATGQEKSEAVRQMVEGPISARWPATALQLHPAVTVVLDEPAASRLDHIDYYRDTYANRLLRSPRAR